MIAVTGANGQLGRLVISALLNNTRKDNIVALVRDPDNADELKRLGVEVRLADYDQHDTLRTAFKGVSKLLLISGNAVGHRVPQHQAVIEAAKEAGVSLFAYTSILKADTSPLALAEEHKLTEERIAQSGLPAVILRNGWYSENYIQNLQGVLQSGMVAGAAGNGKFHTAARADYAEAAARVLTSTASQVGKIYELAGDSGFTLSEYAQLISEKTGQKIPYTNMSQQAFQAMLTEVGVPEGFAHALADAEVCAAKGWLADDSATLSKLIDRPTTRLSDSLDAALNLR